MRRRPYAKTPIGGRGLSDDNPCHAARANRRRILQERDASPTPLSACDLTDRVLGPKKIAPVQEYRALEFIQEACVIHRLATKSACAVCDDTHVDEEAVVFPVCAACRINDRADGIGEAG